MIDLDLPDPDLPDPDLLAALAVTGAIVHAGAIAAAAALLVAGFAVGALWQRRRAGGLRDQRAAADDLAVKLADAEVRARAAEQATARLRDELFTAQRDLDMATERAAAYAHRAELQRARADNAVSRCADLAAEVHDLQGALQRALTAGKRLRDGVEEATTRIVLAELEATTEWEVDPR